MHIESVPNRKSHPTILLRESYRVDGKVRKRTIANLTDWLEQLGEGLRTLLRGGVAVAGADEALTISRSLPHGHVAAVLGTAERIGLAKLLTERRGGAEGRRSRDLVLALIVNRVIAPASKLATVRALNPETAASSLGERLGLGAVKECEIYESGVSPEIRRLTCQGLDLGGETALLMGFGLILGRLCWVGRAVRR